MDEFDDDNIVPHQKNKVINDAVLHLKHELTEKETECSLLKANLQSDMTKLKFKLKLAKQEKEEDAKHYRKEYDKNLADAHKVYEKNVEFIRGRHQESMLVLQSKHEADVQKTITKYEEQIEKLKKQIQKLPDLRNSLQTKDDEIEALKNEVVLKKKLYDEKVAMLIKELEDEKTEEQSEKWDLKKHVEIFKKRCLVLETMLENLQRTNTDLKDKMKEARKNCEIKIAKAKIDYEARQRLMEDELKDIKRDLDLEKQKAASEIAKVNQRIEEDKLTYDSQVFLLTDKAEEQNELRKHLQTQNSKLQTRIGVFRDAVTKIKDQYEITLKEIKEQTEIKNQQHAADINKLVQEMHEVKAQAQRQINEEKSKADEKINEMALKLKEQKKSWIQLENRTDTYCQTECGTNSNEKIAQYEQTLKDIRTKYATEKQEYERTINMLHSEMEEQKACFVKIVELKEQLEVTSNKTDASSDSNRKFFNAFIQLKKDYDVSRKHYNIQIQKHHHEIQKLQTANKELLMKYEKKKSEYDQQQKFSHSFHKQKHELVQANEVMQRKFGVSTKEIEDNIDALKATISQNKVFYEETVLELKTQLEGQIKLHAEFKKKANEDLKQAVTSERMKIQAEIEKFCIDRSTLSAEVHKQQNLIEKLTDEVKLKTKEADVIKMTQINEISSLRKHYDKEIKRTDDLILLLMTDLDHNNKKYNKLKEIKAKASSHTKTKINDIQSTYEHKMKSMENQMEISQQLYEIANGNLKKEIQDLLLNKEMLENAKGQLETENAKYARKMQEANKFCEEMKHKLHTVTSKFEQNLGNKDERLEQQKKTYDGIIENMKNKANVQLQENEDLIEKLQDDVKRGKQYIEQLIDIKGCLENKLKVYENKIVCLQRNVNETFKKYNHQLINISEEDVITLQHS